MLILHRRPEEAIRIGDGIRVVVLHSDSGGARLGIEAPSEVTILREEIVREVEVENRKAWLALKEVVDTGSLGAFTKRDPEGSSGS